MNKKITLNLLNIIISIVFFSILLLFMKSSPVLGEEMWNMNESDNYSIVKKTTPESENISSVISNTQQKSLLAASSPYFSWDNWQNYGVFSNTYNINYYQPIQQYPYNWSAGQNIYYRVNSFGDTKPYFFAGSTGTKIQNYPRPTNLGITEYNVSTSNRNNLKFYTSDEPGGNPNLLTDVVPNNFVRNNNIEYYVTSTKADYILGSGVLSGQPFIGKRVTNGLLYFFDTPETITFSYLIKFTSNLSNGGLVEGGRKRQVWDTGFREPHVFKVFHKDIDTGADISAPQILGKNARIYDKVVANKLTIPNYTYVKGQYYQLDTVNLTETEKSVSSPYESVIDMNKKAIIYFYKKGTLNLSIEKSVDKSIVEIGDTAHYQIQPKNTGSIALEKPLIRDILPEGMEKPTNIRLNSNVLKEGSGNANSSGQYYTWNQSTRTLEVHSEKVTLNNSSKMLIEYDSKVLKGIDGEEKTNVVTLTGENDGGNNPHDEATITIKETEPLKKKILHIKQEVYDPHEDVVVPTIGNLELSNVNIDDLNNINKSYSSTIPSYLVDTLKDYRTFNLETTEEYMGYQVNIKIPEFYKYIAYQITTEEKDHIYINSKQGVVPTLNYKNNDEYWITLYIQPRVDVQGPPFYNWDYKTNDFKTIKL